MGEEGRLGEVLLDAESFFFVRGIGILKGCRGFCDIFTVLTF